MKRSFTIINVSALSFALAMDPSSVSVAVAVANPRDSALSLSGVLNVKVGDKLSMRMLALICAWLYCVPAPAPKRYTNFRFHADCGAQGAQG